MPRKWKRIFQIDNSDHQKWREDKLIFIVWIFAPKNARQRQRKRRIKRDKMNVGPQQKKICFCSTLRKKALVSWIIFIIAAEVVIGEIVQ